MELVEINWKEFKLNFRKDYMESFPAVEKMPLFMLKNKIKTKKFNALALKEDGKYLAFAFINGEKETGFILVYYFAVKKEYRQMGYGSKLLELLKNYNNNIKGIIVEIERLYYGKTEEDNIVRENRLNFYLKNGFVRNDIYVKAFNVDVEILILNIADDNDNPKYIREKYKEIYNKAYSKRMVKHIDVDTWGEKFENNRRKIQSQEANESENGENKTDS